MDHEEDQVADNDADADVDAGDAADDDDDEDVAEDAGDSNAGSEDESRASEGSEDGGAGGSEKQKKGKKPKSLTKPSSSGAPADKKTRENLSDRAGLVFPVHRFSKHLRRGGYTKRLALGGSIYLTAVVEYLTAEILELAGNAAKEQKKKRIIPRHIQLAIRNDEELNKYMSNVTISGGGVVPNIHNDLLPKKKLGKDGKDSLPPPNTMSQEY
jgi:histone H2A